MPVLKTQRETKKIILPNDKEAWVKVYVSQNYGDTKAIQKAALSKMKLAQGGSSDAEKEKAMEKSKNSIEADLSTLISVTLNRMILAWNFTDENKNDLPVTAENIDLLESVDAMFIFGEIGEDETEEEKEDIKKDPSVSSES